MAKKQKDAVIKDDLVNAMAEQAKISKKAAKLALEAVVDEIKNAVRKGRKVSLVGFGSFEVIKTKKRRGVNPQTKQPMTIPAGKKVRFRPGKHLKEAVK